jgi:AAA domain
VPSLIHLNGPPGIGKSTLSALYVNRHPGTLNLDIDNLHQLLGGWQDADAHMHDVLRPLALAMTATHLAGGRDVVLPQYLARVEEIERFERIACEQRANFLEVVLLDEKVASIDRFDSREDTSDWSRHNRRAVTAQGGAVFLAAMYDRLLEVLRRRPAAVVVHSEPGAVEATYALLTQVLAQAETLPCDGSPDGDQPT